MRKNRALHGRRSFDGEHSRWRIARNVCTEGPRSLSAKSNAAVRQIKETRRLLDEPVAAERPEKALKARKRTPLKVASNFRRPEYQAAVRKAKQYIRAGDIFQVVVSQPFSAQPKTPPIEVY